MIRMMVIMMITLGVELPAPHTLLVKGVDIHIPPYMIIIISWCSVTLLRRGRLSGPTIFVFDRQWFLLTDHPHWLIDNFFVLTNNELLVLSCLLRWFCRPARFLVD